MDALHREDLKHELEEIIKEMEEFGSFEEVADALGLGGGLHMFRMHAHCLVSLSYTTEADHVFAAGYMGAARMAYQKARDSARSRKAVYLVRAAWWGMFACFYSERVARSDSPADMTVDQALAHAHYLSRTLRAVSAQQVLVDLSSQQYLTPNQCVTVLLRLGDLYDRSRQPATAQGYYDKAFALGSEGISPEVSAERWRASARHEERYGDPRTAETYFQNAKNVVRFGAGK